MFGRNNSASLARRDPARAALLGAIAGSSFGSERRSRFGREPQFGSEFGADPWGNMPAVPGYGFGADGGGAAPTAQAMQQAWFQQQRQQQANARREQLLEPNKDVAAKVERYAMPISASITIGTPNAALNLSGNPTVTLRPQRVVSNSPCSFFLFLTRMSVANVNVLVGPGRQDSYDYSAEANNTTLDIPTLSPSNPITATGDYSGLIPAGLNPGLVTYTTLTFIGWASVTA